MFFFRSPRKVNLSYKQRAGWAPPFNIWTTLPAPRLRPVPPPLPHSRSVDLLPRLTGLQQYCEEEEEAKSYDYLNRSAMASAVGYIISLINYYSSFIWKQCLLFFVDCIRYSNKFAQAYQWSSWTRQSLTVQRLKSLGKFSFNSIFSPLLSETTSDQLKKKSSSFKKEKKKKKKKKRKKRGLLWKSFQSPYLGIGTVTPRGKLQSCCCCRYVGLHVTPWSLPTAMRKWILGPSHTGSESEYGGKRLRQVSVQAER